MSFSISFVVLFDGVIRVFDDKRIKFKVVTSFQ